MKTCALIIPTAEHVDLAYQAAKSARRTSTWTIPEEGVFFYDDATPRVQQSLWNRLQELWPRAYVYRTERRVGCTMMWNLGLRKARQEGYDYAMLANDDLLFGLGWDQGFDDAINTYRYDFVGPVSNAPGYGMPCQAVTHYLKDYELSNRLEDIDAVSARLAALSDPTPKPGRINGFCIAGPVEKWWRYAFDCTAVFDPLPKYKMQGNEDEFQRRGRGQGMQTAVCPTSFVFHYRSATRGEKYRRDLWMNRPDEIVPLTDD